MPYPGFVTSTMSPLRSTPKKSARNQMLDVLTNAKRREILEVLEGLAPTTERELAVELAATAQGDPAKGASNEEVEAIHVGLRHVHLPKLDDVGLVAWDEDDGTVRETEHPVLDDRQFERLVGIAGGEGDDVLAAVESERRRTTLAVLESRDGSLSRGELAREVAARETDGEPSTEAVNELRILLYHVHLPKLADTGLIEYNDETGSVAYRANGVFESVMAFYNSD